MFLAAIAYGQNWQIRANKILPFLGDTTMVQGELRLHGGARLYVRPGAPTLLMADIGGVIRPVGLAPELLLDDDNLVVDTNRVATHWYLAHYGYLLPGDTVTLKNSILAWIQSQGYGVGSGDIEGVSVTSPITGGGASGVVTIGWDSVAALNYAKQLIAGKLSAADSVNFLAYVKTLIAGKQAAGTYLVPADSSTLKASIQAWVQLQGYGIGGGDITAVTDGYGITGGGVADSLHLAVDTTEVATPYSVRKRVADSLAAVSGGTRALVSPNLGAATGTSLTLTTLFPASSAGSLFYKTPYYNKNQDDLLLSIVGQDSAGVTVWRLGDASGADKFVRLYGNTGYGLSFYAHNTLVMKIDTNQVLTLPTGLTGTLRAASGVVSATPSDTAGLGTSLAAKLDKSDSSTYLTPSDAAAAYQAKDSDLDDLADGTLSGSKVQTFGTSNAGVVGASGGGTTNYLRADGNWAAPPGGSGVSADSVKKWISDSLGTMARLDLTGAEGGTATTSKLWYDPSDSTVKIAVDQNTGGVSEDTVLLYATSIGIGMPTDTALFRQGYMLPSLDNYGTDTLVITRIAGTVHGSSPDVDVKFRFDVNEFDATPTDVNSTALTVTNTTVGNSTTTFANPRVPPGNFLWPALTETAAQPTNLQLRAWGYRSPTVPHYLPDSLDEIDSLKWYVNTNWLTASNGDSIGTVPDTCTGQVDLVAPSGTGRRFVYKTNVFGTYPALTTTDAGKQTMTADSVVKYLRGDNVANTIVLGMAFDSTSTVDWHFVINTSDEEVRYSYYNDMMSDNRTATFFRWGHSADYTAYADTFKAGHVWAFVYANDSVRTYKDGALVAGPTNVTDVGAINPTWFCFGSERTSDGRYSTPIKFSFAAIYKKALSATEVSTVYSRTKKYIGK